MRDENPAVPNASPTAGRADLRDEPDIITISDSDASPLDDAEESTVARYNATVAELAHLCHCLKTQSFPPPRFHFSQLAQFALCMAYSQAKIDFPRSPPAQNVSRLAAERTLSGQRLTETWLETTCEQFAQEATFQAASVIAPLFQGTGSVETLHRFPGVASS